MGNMPILYRNVMDGLRTELGRSAFLWATDKIQNDRHCYKAEAFAHEVEKLADVVWHLTGLGLKRHGAQHSAKHIDLFIFIMRRHAHYRFPSNNEAWI